MRRHSQHKYYKEVDTLEGCVDIFFQHTTYQVDAIASSVDLLQEAEKRNVDTHHVCIDIVKLIKVTMLT